MCTLNSLISFSDTYVFENSMRLEARFIFDMFKLVSGYNRLLISQMLHHDCISYNQLHFNLIKIFQHLYHIPIECRIFEYVLNSLVTSYLRSIVWRSQRFNIMQPYLSSYQDNITDPFFMRFIDELTESCLRNLGVIGCDEQMIDCFSYKIPVVIENTNSEVGVLSRTANVKSMDELTECSSHNFDKIGLDHQRMTDVQIPPKIPVNICSTNSEVEVPLKKDSSESIEKNSVDNDFQSFLLPLEQDHTKSSKGYSCQKTCFDDETEIPNASNNLSLSISVTADDFTDNDELNLSGSEEENYDPAHSNIISRYLNTVQNTSSDSELSNSEVIYDSDGDDHVMFSENCGEDIEEETSSEGSISDECGKKVKHFYSIDSDSDEDVVFSENCGEYIEEETSSERFISNECDKKVKHFYSIDSDSDEDVVFSENSVENMHDKTGSKGHLSNKSDEKSKHLYLLNFDDSDSDEDAIFSENSTEDMHQDSDEEDAFFVSFDNKIQNSSKNCIKNIHDTKFEIYVSSDDDDYDETDSCLVFQSHTLNFSMSSNKNVQRTSSLSQTEKYIYAAQLEGHVNSFFENDSVILQKINIRKVNRNWKHSMQDVSSEPRENKKVSFMPLPDLVSVRTFEPDDDGYNYTSYVIDQMRFQNRIKEFEVIIKPYLSSNHRENIYQQNYSCKN